MEGQDTTFAEDLRIEQRRNSTHYIAAVPKQNDDQAVAFELTQSNTDSVVFNNSTHDFPQRISYKKITADRILARVTAKDEQNKDSGFTLDFQRLSVQE